MTLRWRLAIILAAIVAVAVSTAAYAAYVSAERELIGGVNEFLHDRVDELTGFRNGAVEVWSIKKSPYSSLDDAGAAARMSRDDGA